MILARAALTLALIGLSALLLALGVDVVECPDVDVCAAARAALGDQP